MSSLDLNYAEVVPNLGEDEDEVAVIFKNSDVDNIQWTVPKPISNIQFLAVAGGGGGGGAAAYNGTSNLNRAGGGGGGGGVVTGTITSIKKDAVVSVTIGAGGAGGLMDESDVTGTGAAVQGGSTSLYINDTFYLSAYGGGADTGRSTKGGAGGSNAGSRLLSVNTDLSWKDTAINENVITNGEKYGNLGGKATNAPSEGGRAGGGGGGATEAGGNSSGNKGNTVNDNTVYGGKGGEGLSSDITGTMTVYGSGGGGGSGYRGYGNVGGTGAGKGGSVNNPTDTDEDERLGGNALPNQGGGGGGGGYYRNGGNGGSGIFVLRFKVKKQEETYIKVDIPTLTAGSTLITYNGVEKFVHFDSNPGYTIKGERQAKDVGTYTIIAELNEGYIWSDGSFDIKEIKWSIIQATNGWTTEPKINKTEWTEGDTTVTLTKGVAKFGEVVMKLNNEIITELPTEPGQYTLEFIVNDATNYLGINKIINFEILEKPIITVNNPLTFTAQENGSSITLNKYGDPDPISLTY